MESKQTMAFPWQFYCAKMPWESHGLLSWGISIRVIISQKLLKLVNDSQRYSKPNQ